jgi:predicted acyl esterase
VTDASGPWEGVRDGMRVERGWIPLSDGVRLAVTLYRPAAAGPGDRFPPLLEYLPYRKDDAMFERDYGLYAGMVPRGFVGARVDVRGTGASEGVVPDREYSEQELRDGEEVIAWLARQRWSNGSVGMWGISWGGFNAIQLAMRRPPDLKAICALMATDDLFAGDIHYIDGMFHVDEWELMMDLLNAMSPPPSFPIDDETLAARFDTEPWKLRVMREQRDGPFWRHGAPALTLEDIAVPTMLIGGLLDGYRDAVPRMVQHLNAPVKAIVGPWNHAFPHDASPGPAIEWRAEAARWFDRWLKEVDTGVEGEPSVAVYVRDWHPPGLDLREVPGRWRWLEGWPASEVVERSLFLRADRTLGEDAGPVGEHHLRCVPSVGAEAGLWWGDPTPDQRPIDAVSLAYDSTPLERDLVVGGRPRALLTASADATLANWFVRLCDVAPDGTSSLVAGAGLNGAHRESAVEPRPLEPGRAYRLHIDLHLTTWTFPAGHRLRLAVSNSMFPMIWPTPFPVTTTLAVGGAEASTLVLPVLAGEAPGPKFPSPSPSPKVPAPNTRTDGTSPPGPWQVHRDEARGVTTVSWGTSSTTDLGWCRQTYAERMDHVVEESHPERATADGVAEFTVELPRRILRWVGELSVGGDAERFHYRYRRTLHANDRLIRQREWDRWIPRDHH